jgi:enamine deaminase RidA (YjgF/YER057c/UK114 family)
MRRYCDNKSPLRDARICRTYVLFRPFKTQTKLRSPRDLRAQKSRPHRSPMKYLLALAVFSGVLTCAGAQNEKMTSPGIERNAKNDRSGTAWFVRAPDGPMMFTAQIFAPDVSRDARSQADQALDQLAGELNKAGGDLKRVLRLNAYVSDPSATAAVDAAIATRFADAPPAVTLACTPLTKPGARVAFDAVAAVSNSRGTVEILTGGGAVMPPGGKVFVSGQANRGDNLAASVRTTMESLFKALAHVGLAKTDVVQIKAFITPFADHAAATAEVKKSFGDGPMPPLVFIEWISTSPAEIELIAAAPKITAKQEDAAAYVSLPGMTTSPFFSRIATVAAGSPLIFIAGIDGGESGTSREQWKRVFDQLGTALFDSGSSFRHMVKATYFLHDDKARDMLGAIRGVYYDPARPPSASALDVTKMARPGRHVMLDMIAVPAK